MGYVCQGERGERRRDHGHQKSYNAVDRFFHPANMRQRFVRASLFDAHCLPSSPPARSPVQSVVDSPPARPPWRRTFNEIPSWSAFTAVAPTERPNCAATFADGSFCAIFFNIAMSSAVQRRNVGLGIGSSQRHIKMSKCCGLGKVPVDRQAGS